VSSAPHDDDAIMPEAEHPVSDLTALVQGELGVDDLRRVVSHARTCPSCQAELVEIAAGSGVLRRAARIEPAAPVALPPPSFLDQIVRGSEPPPPPTPLRPSRPLRWAAIAAAVIVGVAGVAWALDRGGRARPTTVALAPLSPSGAYGTVKMQPAGADQTMTVTTALPPSGAGAYYEVWLLRRRTGAMVPVGVLPQTGTGRYVIPGQLVSAYDAVDISLQPDNGSTAHSDDSVLRALYS